MDQQEQILHQLFQSVRAITKGLNALFEPYQLYSSEWTIITTLKQTGPISQDTLASYLMIEPPAVSRSLSTLEKKGLVKRVPGKDKREKMVSLSEKSLALYDSWLTASQQHRHAMLAHLDEQAQRQLLTALQTISENARQFNK